VSSQCPLSLCESHKSHERRHIFIWNMGAAFDALDGNRRWLICVCIHTVLTRKDMILHARGTKPVLLVAGKAAAWTAIRLVRLFEAHTALRVVVFELVTPRELGLDTAQLLCDRCRTDCRELVHLGLPYRLLFARLGRTKDTTLLASETATLVARFAPLIICECADLGLFSPQLLQRRGSSCWCART